MKPRYKWDTLLRKMVSDASFTIEQTYQKISRRAIGTMQQVITRGKGAIKPGDIKTPSKKKIKLAVIIDSSGSMSYVIHKVMSNLDALLANRGSVTGLSEEFYLFMFSGSYDIFKCTPGQKGSAQEYADVDAIKPSTNRMPLQDVLSKHMAGGTVFSSELSEQIDKLAGRGYNCLIVTDGDLLAGSNFENFKKLYNSHRTKIWLMLDSAETFASFCDKMKEISSNATYLPEE